MLQESVRTLSGTPLSTHRVFEQVGDFERDTGPIFRVVRIGRKQEAVTRERKVAFDGLC